MFGGSCWKGSQSPSFKKTIKDARNRLPPRPSTARSSDDRSSAGSSVSIRRRPETADQTPWPGSGTRQAEGLISQRFHGPEVSALSLRVRPHAICSASHRPGGVRRRRRPSPMRASTSRALLSPACLPLCHRHRLPLLRPLIVALRVRRIKSIYEIRTFPGTPTPVTTTQGSASVGLLRCRNRPVGTDARSHRGCALLGDRLTSSEIAPGLRTRTGDIPGSRPLG
jgi:hypothetical protein